jgi:broad specificity polyphosphatase/5'/3'-nucleotidase SurE
VCGSGFGDPPRGFKPVTVVDPSRRPLAGVAGRLGDVVGRRGCLPRFGNARGAKISIPNRSRYSSRLCAAAQGRRGQERSQIDARRDGRGNPYYWITCQPRGAVKASKATDLAVLDGRCIAVTPLKIDMTDKPCIAQLARLFE